MALLDLAIRRSTAWHTGLAGVATLLIVSVPVGCLCSSASLPSAPVNPRCIGRSRAGRQSDRSRRRRRDRRHHRDARCGGRRERDGERRDGSPLIAAAGDGHLDVVRLLLDRGANINLAVQGDGSALIAAAGAEEESHRRRAVPAVGRGTRLGLSTFLPFLALGMAAGAPILPLLPFPPV